MCMTMDKCGTSVSTYLNGVHQQLNIVLMEGLLKAHPRSRLHFHMTRWMLHKHNDYSLFRKPQGYVCMACNIDEH